MLINLSINVTCSVRLPADSHCFIAGQYYIEIGLRVHVYRRRDIIRGCLRGHLLENLVRKSSRFLVCLVQSED